MLVLASASPARAELLRAAGLDPTIMPVNLDEESYKECISDPEELVRTLAEAKLNACLENLRRDGVFPPCTIVSADTIVFFQGKIIGKPKDRSEAKEIISSLQGSTHVVWSGACIIQANSRSNDQSIKQVLSDSTSVTFKLMSEQEIETYLDSNDWIGAAGAYRLKQSIAQFVEKVDGDESTVIGLPTSVIMQLS